MSVVLEYFRNGINYSQNKPDISIAYFDKAIQKRLSIDLELGRINDQGVQNFNISDFFNQCVGEFNLNRNENENLRLIYSDAYLKRGIAIINQIDYNDDQNPINDLKKAIQLCPENANIINQEYAMAYLNRGIKLNNNNNSKDISIKCYKKAIELNG
ncbi:MAG: hypothetical protein QM528_07420 [Phycisphaerales bacterium]|nr:hypothetical protein [Phycisphaerales bacterium]